MKTSMTLATHEEKFDTQNNFVFFTTASKEQTFTEEELEKIQQKIYEIIKIKDKLTTDPFVKAFKEQLSNFRKDFKKGMKEIEKLIDENIVFNKEETLKDVINEVLSQAVGGGKLGMVQYITENYENYIEKSKSDINHLIQYATCNGHEHIKNFLEEKYSIQPSISVNFR